MVVSNGIDVLLAEGGDRFDGLSIGLVTNHTGVTSDLEYNREALLNAGVDLRKLYCPEHGLWGLHGASEDVGDYTDDLTGLPCHSLYGDYRTPTANMLDGIDVLLFDIQDAGSRCYTYTATMINSMRATAEHGLPFVVLDRPNPLTGTLVNGRPIEPSFESFIGH
jgi:beta-N-acetylhexosaminidase